MKRNKYLIRALNSLRLDIPEANEEKDIDALIKEAEQNKAEMENYIIKMQDNIVIAKEVISDCDTNIGHLNNVKHQMKVERYKELNPGKDIF